MYIASRWHDRNLSRLEIIFAVMMFILFVSIFSFYALKLFARVEKTIVTMTVNNINITLRGYSLQAIINNDFKKISELQNKNPFSLILNSTSGLNSKVVENEKAIKFKGKTHEFLGEFDSENLNNVSEGNWYYDPVKKELFYFIKNTEFFKTDLEGKKRIQYSIHIDYIDNNKNQKYDTDIDGFRSIKLLAKNDYSWDV
jgi:hypothetical protein